MRTMHPYIQTIIETNIDLIEAQDYERLLKRCRKDFRNELIHTLKDAVIDLGNIKIEPKYGALIDPRKINQLIKNKLLELGVSYFRSYNDKGKTGRKFKYEGINIAPSYYKTVIDAVEKLLEDNAVDYDYVTIQDVYSNWRFHTDLIVRINADEV